MTETARILAYLTLMLSRPDGPATWWTLQGRLNPEHLTDKSGDLLVQWHGAPVCVASSAGGKAQWCTTWGDGLQHIAEHHPELRPAGRMGVQSPDPRLVRNDQLAFIFSDSDDK